MSRVERNADIYEENRKASGSGSRFNVICGNLLSVLGHLFMILVLVSCLSIIIPNIAGFDSYVVASGSMEPNLPVGSIVYVKQTDPGQLQQGDVIVFNDPTRSTAPITHRVVSNDTAAQTITTKGDANENKDINPVTYDRVVGVVKAHVPYLGFAAALFSGVLGKIVAVLIVIEAWLLTEIGRRLKGSAKKRS